MNRLPRVFALALLCTTGLPVARAAPPDRPASQSQVMSFEERVWHALFHEETLRLLANSEASGTAPFLEFLRSRSSRVEQTPNRYGFMSRNVTSLSAAAQRVAHQLTSQRMEVLALGLAGVNEVALLATRRDGEDRIVVFFDANQRLVTGV